MVKTSVFKSLGILYCTFVIILLFFSLRYVVFQCVL
jgi:hypothetical protein